MLPSHLATRLLPLVFEDVESQPRLNILDIGAATAESVQFFGRYRCRLQFADLFGETGYRREHQRRRRPHETVFDRVFDFPTGTMFDVCLFWDFLNYLDTGLLRDLAQTLRRHVHEGTRAHAFVPFSNALPFAGMRFGLARADQLTVKNDPPPPPPHPHTNKVIAGSFWPFAVTRATLLEENRQELLMEVRLES